MMRQRTIALVGTSSGTLQQVARRRTLVASASALAASSSTTPLLAARDHSRLAASPATRRSEEAWQSRSVRWAHIQHNDEGRSTTGQHGDGFPPPSMPRRRPSGSSAIGTKRSTAAPGASSVSATLRGKAAAREPAASQKSAAPKSDVDRVSTTLPEEAPKQDGDAVPLPDDPTAPSRKEHGPSKDTVKAPSPQPRQDPQGIKKEEEKKSLKARVLGLWENVKYLFRFYKEGVKQIWRDRTMVAEMRKSIAEREQQGKGGMLWLEKKVIELHQADVRKLPLFLAILLILEEVLPLVVIYAPSLLPSTCILPSQAEKMQSEEERRRGVAIQKLATDEAVTVAVARIGQEQQAANEDMSSESRLSELATMSSPTLAQLADVFALRSWGAKSMILMRLRGHFRTLQEDDAFLRRAYEARNTTSQWNDICNGIWLQRACAQRGLRSFEASQADMTRNLEAYLHLAQPQSSPLDHALLPLALYDGTHSYLVHLERESQREHQKGIRQRSSEVVASVVEAEKSKGAGKA